MRHGRADARARGRAGDRHVVCLARALRRRRHARCHTHRIQRAGTEPPPPSRCAGGRSRDARPQPIDHSRRQPEQRVAAHECGMPIRGPRKVTDVRPRTSQPRTLPSVGPVGRLYGFRAMCNERSRRAISVPSFARNLVSYSEYKPIKRQPERNARSERAPALQVMHSSRARALGLAPSLQSSAAGCCPRALCLGLNCRLRTGKFTFSGCMAEAVATTFRAPLALTTPTFRAQMALTC